MQKYQVQTAQTLFTSESNNRESFNTQYQAINFHYQTNLSPQILNKVLSITNWDNSNKYQDFLQQLQHQQQIVSVKLGQIIIQQKQRGQIPDNKQLKVNNLLRKRNSIVYQQHQYQEKINRLSQVYGTSINYIQHQSKQNIFTQELNIVNSNIQKVQNLCSKIHCFRQNVKNLKCLLSKKGKNIYQLHKKKKNLLNYQEQLKNSLSIVKKITNSQEQEYIRSKNFIKSQINMKKTQIINSSQNQFQQNIIKMPSLQLSNYFSSSSRHFHELQGSLIKFKYIPYLFVPQLIQKQMFQIFQLRLAFKEATYFKNLTEDDNQIILQLMQKFILQYLNNHNIMFQLKKIKQKQQNQWNLLNITYQIKPHNTNQRLYTKTTKLINILRQIKIDKNNKYLNSVNKIKNTPIKFDQIYLSMITKIFEKQSQSCYHITLDQYYKVRSIMQQLPQTINLLKKFHYNKFKQFYLYYLNSFKLIYTNLFEFDQSYGKVGFLFEEIKQILYNFQNKYQWIAKYIENKFKAKEKLTIDPSYNIIQLILMKNISNKIVKFIKDEEISILNQIDNMYCLKKQQFKNQKEREKNILGKMFLFNIFQGRSLVQGKIVYKNKQNKQKQKQIVINNIFQNILTFRHSFKCLKLKMKQFSMKAQRRFHVDLIEKLQQNIIMNNYEYLIKQLYQNYLNQSKIKSSKKIKKQIIQLQKNINISQFYFQISFQEDYNETQIDNFVYGEMLRINQYIYNRVNTILKNQNQQQNQSLPIISQLLINFIKESLSPDNVLYQFSNQIQIILQNLDNIQKPANQQRQIQEVTLLVQRLQQIILQLYCYYCINFKSKDKAHLNKQSQTQLYLHQLVMNMFSCNLYQGLQLKQTQQLSLIFKQIQLLLQKIKINLCKNKSIDFMHQNSLNLRIIFIIKLLKICSSDNLKQIHQKLSKHLKKQNKSIKKIQSQKQINAKQKKQGFKFKKLFTKFSKNSKQKQPSNQLNNTELILQSQNIKLQSFQAQEILQKIQQNIDIIANTLLEMMSQLSNI